MAVLIQHSSVDADMDLRQTISRRLAAIIAERRRFEGRINILLEIEKELRTLLDEEAPPTRSPNISPFAVLGEGEEEIGQNARLKEFIQERLRTESLTLDQLVDAVLANGFAFGDKSVRRVLHFNLLNLKNSGLIEKDGEAWKLVPRPGVISHLLRGKSPE